MTKKKEVFDCRTCGLCCVSVHDQDAFCDLTEKDIERLGARLQRHIVWADVFTLAVEALSGRRATPPAALATRWRRMRAGPFKGIEACVCVFLQGSLLHRTNCRVYARRPYVCREAVRPGTRLCRDIRRMYREQLSGQP
jgi:Fe-S-cluster containining protein